MDEPIIRLVDMPYAVRGFSAVDEDGTPLIYINARLSSDAQRKTYDHEFKHLQNNDHYNSLPIEGIEAIASNKPVLVEEQLTEQPATHPYGEYYRRGFELYGLERDDYFWDKLFLVWSDWSKNPYEGVIDDDIDRYTRRQVGRMIINIFGDDTQRKKALKKEVKKIKAKLKDQDKDNSHQESTKNYKIISPEMFLKESQEKAK